MTILFINIALAIFALFTSLAPIGGETWHKNEPKFRKRLTWRGRISCILIVATAVVTVIREKETKFTHDNENKQLIGQISNLQARIQVNDNARLSAELRQQALLEQLIGLATAQKETLIESQKETRNKSISAIPKVAALESKINQYKEELQIISKAVSSTSDQKKINHIQNKVEPQHMRYRVTEVTDHTKPGLEWKLAPPLSPQHDAVQVLFWTGTGTIKICNGGSGLFVRENKSFPTPRPLQDTVFELKTDYVEGDTIITLSFLRNGSYRPATKLRVPGIHNLSGPTDQYLCSIKEI